MNQEIILKQRHAMKQEGLQALVASSPENFAYTVGFVVPSQLLMRWRHAMCIVDASGHTTTLTIDMEETTVRSHVECDDVRVYQEFTDDPILELARALSEHELGSSVIGIEMEYLPAKDFATLSKALPHARFVAADSIFQNLRQVKTSHEVDLLRSLSRITDEAIGSTLRDAKVGMTELELAGQLTSRIFSGGAQDFKLMIVASGERSQFPNVGPTARRLSRGDLIRMEIFGVRDGYHAGVCRTAVVGEPTMEQTRIWRNLIECKHLVMELIEPGARAKQIYERFLEKFEELGLEPISFVGHGIGVFLHEEPYLGRYGDATLEAGMVLAIEPLVYIPGRMGLQNKDMLLVTDDGCELLSDATPTDRLIEVG
jgi:Xaa-Pro dipeptidase